jgi:hypothetical protein
MTITKLACNRLMFLSLDIWSKSIYQCLEGGLYENILVMNKNNANVIFFLNFYLKFLYITRYSLNMLWKIIIDLQTQILNTFLVFPQIYWGVVEVSLLSNVYSMNFWTCYKFIYIFSYEEHKRKYVVRCQGQDFA